MFGHLPDSWAIILVVVVSKTLFYEAGKDRVCRIVSWRLGVGNVELGFMGLGYGFGGKFWGWAVAGWRFGG